MKDVKLWFYAVRGQQMGPVPREEIERLFGVGGIDPSTLVWTEGMKDWEPAGHCFPGLPQIRPPALGSSQHAATGSAGAGWGGARGVESHLGPDGLYVNAPARTFGQAISVCLGRYFQFSGRASRSEYWYFVLFSMLATMAASLIDSVVFYVPSWEEYGPVGTLVWWGLLVPSLAVTWRRLHDTNRSGWWVGGLFIILPMAFLIMPLFFPALFMTDSEAWIGFWLIVPVLAFIVYMIILFVFVCTRGELQPNRYG